jgi:hypothetical protein
MTPWQKQMTVRWEAEVERAFLNAPLDGILITVTNTTTQEIRMIRIPQPSLNVKMIKHTSCVKEVSVQATLRMADIS